MTGPAEETPRLFQTQRDKLLWIVFLTFMAYSSAVRGGFIWDDNEYVTENPLLTASDGLTRIWTTTETPQYYPLVFTTFWVESRLWGLNPAGFHVVNVFLHAINAVLVWRILRRMNVPGAWMVGAVFAVHPVHVESVAWVTERKNVLSGIFYLLAIGSYLRFEEQRRWYWYGGSLLLFVLSLLSKTVTATLPVALLLIRWYQGRPIGRKQIGLLIPFFAVGTGLGLTTAWLEVNRVGAEGQIWNLSYIHKMMLAGKILVFYAWKLIWPVNLIFNYPRWELDVKEWSQWGSLIGVGIVGLLVWLMKDKWGRGPAAGLGFFIVTLGPVLGFLKVYPFYFSYVADHFQYLASLGIITLVIGGGTWVLDRELKSRWHLPMRTQEYLKPSLAIVILMVLAFLTWQQGRIYQNNFTLFQDTLRKNPDSFLAHNNLGTLLGLKGEHDKAVGHFREAVRIKPGDASAHYNLGSALHSQGRLDEAISHYHQALDLKPDYVNAHYHLGLALQSQGKQDEAINQYDQALKIDPENAALQYQLGDVLIRTGQLDKAVNHFQEAVRINPNAPDPLNAAAWILATSPDSNIRNPDQAIRFAERAAELSRHEDPRILDTLAAAYASGGKFDQAVATAQKAILLASSSQKDKLADRIRKRMELYRQALPYREPEGESPPSSY
jgi:tetratricopeptide (TPR) repeat protein